MRKRFFCDIRLSNKIIERLSTAIANGVYFRKYHLIVVTDPVNPFKNCHSAKFGYFNYIYLTEITKLNKGNVVLQIILPSSAKCQDGSWKC